MGVREKPGQARQYAAARIANPGPMGASAFFGRPPPPPAAAAAAAGGAGGGPAAAAAAAAPPPPHGYEAGVFHGGAGGYHPYQHHPGQGPGPGPHYGGPYGGMMHHPDMLRSAAAAAAQPPPPPHRHSHQPAAAAGGGGGAHGPPLVGAAAAVAAGRAGPARCGPPRAPFFRHCPSPSLAPPFPRLAAGGRPGPAQFHTARSGPARPAAEG